MGVAHWRLFYNEAVETVAFEELVIAAVEALPQEFRDLLDNVDVVITDRPTDAQRRLSGRRCILLGLYEGVPRIARGVHYQLALPDKITLFQGNIEESCRLPEEIPARITSVVRHEIAHHFGLTDEELGRIERRTRSAER